MVLPSETNPLNNLFGGELLARMDRAASIAARRHSRRITVTASVNHVAFNKSVLQHAERRKYYFGFVEQVEEEKVVRMKFLNSSME